MDSVDWLAGMLEGEGHFSLYVRENGNLVLRVSINMTDEDIIRRIAAAAGVGKVLGPYIPENERHTPFWRWHVNRREDIIDLCLRVRPLMGERRGARIDAILQAHREIGMRRWTHGTRWGYERGCRCTECRAAHASHHREKRRRQREASERSTILA